MSLAGNEMSDDAKPVETRFLMRPKGRIAYDVRGDGPLVVCIPGMGDLRSGFRALVPDLVAAGYRVVTMDLRGHGESDAAFDEYDDVAAGSDALALVRELGGTSAALVGSSMGAGAAAWAAAESPNLVSALVLSGPFVRNPPGSGLTGLAFRVALLRPWGPIAWDAWYTRLFPGRRPADLDEHRARIRSSLARPGRWHAFTRTTHTSHAPVEERLGEIRAPALVVMGERDPDFKDPAVEASWIAQRVHGRSLVVPGAGHYPHAEYPDVVTPAIVSFLAEAVRHA